MMCSLCRIHHFLFLCVTKMEELDYLTRIETLVRGGETGRALAYIADYRLMLEEDRRPTYEQRQVIHQFSKWVDENYIVMKDCILSAKNQLKLDHLIAELDKWARRFKSVHLYDIRSCVYQVKHLYTEYMRNKMSENEVGEEMNECWTRMNDMITTRLQLRPLMVPVFCSL